MIKRILFPLFCFCTILGNAQTLDSISPKKTVRGATLDVNIYGTGMGFSAGTNSSWIQHVQGSPTVYSISNTVVTSSKLRAHFVLPSNIDTGYYDFLVLNSMHPTQALLHSFYVGGSNISSISPAAATAGQSLDVTITGRNTNFKSSSPTLGFYYNQGSSTTWVYPTSLTATNASTINAHFDIPSNTREGAYTVRTTDIYDGQLDLLEGFYIYNPYSPSLGTVSPLFGYINTRVAVTIGAHYVNFSQGKPTAWLVQSKHPVSPYTIYADSARMITPNSLKAYFTIPNNAAIVGTYDVAVFDSVNGRIQRPQSFVIQYNVGIKEKASDENVIYPNPVHDKVMGVVETSGGKEAEIKVYSISGEFIELPVTQTVIDSKIRFSVDMSACKTGIYLIKVKSPEKSFFKKIVKL